MQKVLYFGHPINVYDTDLERSLLHRIGLGFPGWYVENPNQKKHDEGYARYKRETGRPMDYYTIEVLPKCHGGVFLPFRDGTWGAGVFKEMEAIAGRGCPIWQISWDGHILAARLDTAYVLSVEQTRARIRDAAGNPLPY